MDKIEKLKRKLKTAEADGDAAAVQKLKKKIAEKSKELKDDGDGESSLISSLVASAQKRKKEKSQSTDEKVNEGKKKAKVEGCAPAAAAAAAAESDSSAVSEKPQETGNVTILLFYAYVRPSWTKQQHDDAITFTYQTLKKYGCTGRLRVAREGLNSTLSGPHDGIRNFTRDLRAYQPEHFGTIMMM
jgi:hypothetical protein